MRKLSIAMSGGGHRATLFGVGALQYLADAGVNADVVSVASVSGGSITNGLVGQEVDYAAVSGDRFESAVTRPLVEQITRHGSLFAARITRWYLAGLVIGGIVVLVGPWLLVGLPWIVRLALFVVGLLLLGAYAGLRGAVCRRALRSVFFSPGGTPARLTSMHGGVDHVICATELCSGRHVYFGRDIVSGYPFGCGQPADVEIATAVAASAALPMAFTPTVVPTAPLHFEGARFDVLPNKQLPRSLHLVDGGVYDNMGEQWAAGYADRVARKALPPRYADRAPDELIVVNASAGADWTRRPGLGVPIWGEIVALRGDQGIQYDNTTAHRRTALIAAFQHADDSGVGLRGTYVGINQSPYGVASKWLHDPVRGPRAQAVIERLDAAGTSRTTWTEIAKENEQVKTQLSKMDVETAASLVWQAYVVTMCNAHVILGMPLCDIPDRARFEYRP